MLECRKLTAPTLVRLPRLLPERFAEPLWPCLGVTALGLLVCLSEPRPGSHSFLHAVRVGEASNPGPQSNSDADTALAFALLEVLKSWKRPGGTGGSGTPDAYDASKSKSGKGKGKPSSNQESGSGTSHGSGLADRLMQMLRAAIAQQWSEDKLAERLTNKLQSWLTVRGQQTGCAPQPQFQSLDAVPSKGKGKPKVKGDASVCENRGNPTFCEEVSKGKGAGVTQHPPVLQASAKPKPQPPRQHLPRYAAQVARAEWDSGPVLCTPGSLKKALSDGNEVVGNLIVARDPNCVAEVQALCDTFGYEGELSVATVAEQELLLPSVTDNRPQRLKLRVTQINAVPGPDIKPPVSVTLKPPRGPQLCSLRVVAPGVFRQGFPVQGQSGQSRNCHQCPGFARAL